MCVYCCWLRLLWLGFECCRLYGFIVGVLFVLWWCLCGLLFVCVLSCWLVFVVVMACVFVVVWVMYGVVG